MAWYNTIGQATDTVISSRVRLARNINGYPFASRLDANAANEIIEKVSDPAVWELMYFGKSCADEKYREKNGIR